MRIPQLFSGKPDAPPVLVRFNRRLVDTSGNPADGTAFIRNRLIVLDVELKSSPGKLGRILLHECFHFVWVRLGNPKRASWERFLRTEALPGARGEAGWSAEWRRGRLGIDDMNQRSRRWREYCCESFCDTGAAIYSGDKSETTLAASRLLKRERWFRETLGSVPFPI